MTALMILVLFAMAALAIDLAILHTARTSAQHVAHAAALAGAFTFLNPTALQPAQHKMPAIAIAAQNKIMGQALKITAANVNVDQGNRQVTVTVPRTGANGIKTYFARAWVQQSVSPLAPTSSIERFTF